MALEIVRPDTGSGETDGDTRRVEAEQRAFRALESILGGTETDPRDITVEIGEDEVVDVRDGAAGDPVWVSVADAAERAGVSTSTVRQWYRGGRLATQRREGARGAFLVPLSDVLRLATLADEDGDPGQDSVIDINAGYWAAETQVARTEAAEARAAADDAIAEARRLAADLEDAREQIESAREHLRNARADAAATEASAAELHREVDFLRAQLAETHEELRGHRDEIAHLRGDLDVVRRKATFGSVTSTEWVDQVESGYRGPFRPQARFDEPVAAEAAEGEATEGETAEVSEVPVVSPLDDVPSYDSIAGDTGGPYVIEDVQDERPAFVALPEDDVVPLADDSPRHGRRRRR